VRQGREVVYALRDEHVAHIVADAIAHAVESEPAGSHTAEASAAEAEPC
jgi:ArsR family transcriptional regulator